MFFGKINSQTLVILRLPGSRNLCQCWSTTLPSLIGVYRGPWGSTMTVRYIIMCKTFYHDTIIGLFCPNWPSISLNKFHFSGSNKTSMEPWRKLFPYKRRQREKRQGDDCLTVEGVTSWEKTRKIPTNIYDFVIAANTPSDPITMTLIIDVV